MTEENAPSGAELTPKERSLVTVAALTTGGNVEQLKFHLRFAVENGNTEAELIEPITHLAFYAGWPKSMSAMAVASADHDGTDWYEPVADDVYATAQRAVGARASRP